MTPLADQVDVAGRLWPLHVPDHLPTSDRLPAEHGEFAGCNVLLLTLDTTRADRIGCYGNQDIETPTLDRLATEGVILSRFVSTSPTTLPSHASIHTGLYPYHHGARSNGVFRVDEEHTTLAEVLKSEGYRTGAVVSSFALDSQFGLAQGFDHYDDDMSNADEPLPEHYPELPAGYTTDRAIRWLRQTSGPFFLWVHYFDPHHAYLPPSPFAEKYDQNPYDGEIAYLDSQLSRLLKLLDELNLSENTLVVVAGDHGESLGQHDEFTHGYLTYDATLHVPLIMRCGSRLGGGLHVTRRASQIDLVPTILGLLGKAVPESVDGRDLASAPSERVLFFETLYGTITYAIAPLAGAYAGDFKYIESSTPELFDLSRDAYERNNIIADNPELAERLRTLVAGVYGPGLEFLAGAKPTHGISAMDLEKLEALGYVGATANVSGDVASLPNPYTLMRPIHRVYMAKFGESDEQCIEALEQVLEEHPDLYPALKALGDVHHRAEHLPEAAAAYARCIELRPDIPSTLLALAQVEGSMGNTDAALELIATVLGPYPDHLTARSLQGAVLARAERYAEAIAPLQYVFERHPGEAQCIDLLIRAYVAEERPSELEQYVDERLGAQPHPTMVLVKYARYLEQRGQFTKAVGLLRKALDQDEDVHAVNALALLLASCPDDSVRDLPAAAKLVEGFYQRTNCPDASALLTLSSIYAQGGSLAEALTTAERGEAVAREAGDARLSEAFERLLARLRAAPQRSAP